MREGDAIDLILRNARLAVEPGRLVDVGLAGRAIAVSVVKRGIQLSVVMTATEAPSCRPT